MTDVPEGDSSENVSLYDIRRIDPAQEMVDTSGFTEEELDQITRILTAIAGWREAEEEMRAFSRRYMKLNDTDMRALRYIIFATHQGLVITPRKLTEHLRISSAATTKLLDRLEKGGHLVRTPHPTDRRALTLAVTPETHAAATSSVGRMQAQRFHAAARLDPRARATVARFLEDLAASTRAMTESAGRGTPLSD